MTKHAHSGQTHVEYGIVLGLIALIAQGSLTDVGSKLIGLYRGTASALTEKGYNMTNGGNTADKLVGDAIIKLLGSKDATTSSKDVGYRLVTDPTTGTSRLIPVTGSSDSSTTSVDGVTEAVKKLGTGGATMQFASLLDAMSDQLLASGEITEAQAQTLQALSSQAHVLAEIERLVEMAATNSNNDLQTYTATKLAFQGQNYDTRELGKLIGFAGVDPGKFDTLTITQLLAPAAHPTPEVGEFLDLYRQADSAGTLDNPTVKSLVDSMVTEIAMLAESVEHADYMIRYGGATTMDGNMITSLVAS